MPQPQDHGRARDGFESAFFMAFVHALNRKSAFEGPRLEFFSLEKTESDAENSPIELQCRVCRVDAGQIRELSDQAGFLPRTWADPNGVSILSMPIIPDSSIQLRISDSV